VYDRTLNWALYLRLFDGSRRLLALTVVTSIGQAALLIPVAALIVRVFDRAIPQKDPGAVTVAALALLALYAASTGLALVTRYLSIRINTRATVRLREQLVERLYGLSRADVDQASSAELQSMIVQDSERIDMMSNAVISSVVPAALVALGLSVVALVLSPQLFATVLATIPVVAIAHRLFVRRIRGRARRWQRASDRFAAGITLGLRAMPLTQIHGARDYEVRRHTMHVHEAGAARSSLLWASGAYSLVQSLISACAGVLVLLLGGWMTARGDMSLGSLLAFYALFVLLLRQVSVVVTAVPVAIAGYESIARLGCFIRARDTAPYHGTRAIDFHGGLTLEAVSFSYGRADVLRDVDLTISPGERIAIVGPNGAGKSTLVSLLLGLYRPQSGRLLADGVPFDEVDSGVFRRSVRAVLQETIIFPGTIAENIAYGRPDATADEIRRAAEWATANEFVCAMPDGYDTAVGDEGVRLSGGQRQRIGIARAVLSMPSLLILDEPTTSLDDDAAAKLMRNLEQFPRTPTLVVISHDPKVENWAQRVLHLRNGMIVEDRRSQAVLSVPAWPAGP